VPQYKGFDFDFPISVWEVVLTGRMSHTGLLRKYREEDKKAAEEALKTVEMSSTETGRLGSFGRAAAESLYCTSTCHKSQTPASRRTQRRARPSYAGRALPPSGQAQTENGDYHGYHDLSAVSVYVDKIACLNRTLPLP